MEISVISICAASGDDIAVCVSVSNGEQTQKEKFVISAEAYTRMGILKGECDARTYEMLEWEAGVNSAFRRAMAILGFGACSKRMLVSKLLQKGFEKEYAVAAAERADGLGFIDDCENARREAEKCVSKLWGEVRIKASLAQKGYGSDAVESALCALEDDGVDFLENCRELIAKKYPVLPTERNEKQKLVASLMRYGYTLSQIRSALGN